MSVQMANFVAVRGGHSAGASALMLDAGRDRRQLILDAKVAQPSRVRRVTSLLRRGAILAARRHR